MYDLLNATIDHHTASGKESLRLQFGPKMDNSTIPQNDFLNLIMKKYSPLKDLGIKEDSITFQYFGKMYFYPSTTSLLSMFKLLFLSYFLLYPPFFLLHLLADQLIIIV